MTEQRKQRLKRIGAIAGRTSALYLLLVIVSFLSWAFLQTSAFQRNIEGFWSDTLYFQVGYVYSLLVFFSLASVFQIHNSALKKYFFDAERDRNSIFHIMVLTLKSTDFRIGSAVLAVLSVLLSGLPPLSLLKNGFEAYDGAWETVLKVLASTPALWTIYLFATLSTLSWWRRDKRKSSEEDRPLRGLLIQLTYTTLLWLLGGFLLSILWPLLSGFFKLIYRYLAPAILLLLAMLLARTLGRWGVLLARRRSFLKRLGRVCFERGLELRVEGHPCMEALFPGRTGRIVINGHGKRFVCRFVGGFQQKTPLELREDGIAEYAKFRLWWSHVIQEPYAFEEEAEVGKLLIVCPCRGMVFAAHSGARRQLESGDRVMDYRVYLNFELLNALERDCL